jgi:FMN phosphatase YigB (HAD superfamily)
VSPEETVFVGDNPTADIDGATNCGMYTVFVPGRHGQTYEGANAIFHDFSNLIGIVENAI